MTVYRVKSKKTGTTYARQCQVTDRLDWCYKGEGEYRAGTMTEAILFAHENGLNTEDFEIELGAGEEPTDLRPLYNRTLNVLGLEGDA